MPRLNSVNKNIVTGITLGLFALGTNVALHLTASGSWIPFGNIFLFLSALALGPLGGICSVGAGVIPQTVVLGEHLSGLRLIILCLALGYASRHKPQLPAFLFTAGLWLVVFAPALLMLKANALLPLAFNADDIVFAGIGETTLTLISSALLLNQTVWCLIARTPRHTPFSAFMVHTLTLVSIISVLGVLLLTGMVRGDAKVGMMLDPDMSLGSFVTFFLAMLFLPALCGERLAKILTSNFQEFFGADLMLNAKSKSFSGLSSDHWRRQEVSSPTVSGASSVDLWHSVGSWRGEGVNADTFIEQQTQGVCAIRSGGIISFVNRAFIKLLGIEESNLVGKGVHALGLDPDFCAEIVELVQNTLSKGPQHCELKLRGKEDKLNFFDVNTQLSKSSQEESADDGAQAVIVTLKDITRRRSIEQHLLNAQRMESVGSLVAGLVHEVNNALTSVIGKASLAQKSLSDQASVKESLNDILEASRGAGKTLRQLLEFAEDGPASLETININSAIDERLALLQKLVGEAIEIEFENEERELGVKCDTRLLTQALTNLVLNAKDAYNKSGGRILIKVDTEDVDEVVSQLHMGARPGTFVRVHIQDFGTGMNRDVFTKAFDPMFSTKIGSSGLGLSIVYATMRAHDGFLTAESHPGKGTSVALYFPLRELEERVESGRVSGATTFSQDIEALLGHNEKILVVEDEPTVRELVASMLSELGYQVTSCCNGPEALDISANKGFDLVLVDMVMPKMRGVELIERIRNSRGSIRSLLMTGYNSDADSYDMSVIHKPFDITTLAKAVKTTLTSEKSTQSEREERISSEEIRM